MDNAPTDNNSPVFDGKLLAGLIVELNIARRNFGSYPAGHPLVTSSLNKVVDIYHRLLAAVNTTVVIGVARTALVVQGELLDKNNTIFRGFAKVLFEHGIGALTLRQGLTIDELNDFNRILCLKREDLIARGGIMVLWEQSGIVSLEVKPVRYDLFNVVDSDSTPHAPHSGGSLWEHFASALIRTTGGMGNGVAQLAGQDTASPDGFKRGIDGVSRFVSGDIAVSDDEIDPRLLASILNRQLGAGAPDMDNGYATHQDLETTGSSVKSALEDVAQNSVSDSRQTEASYRKLALFVSSLDPELRRRFLSDSFDIASISGLSLGEEIAPHLSLEAVAETLDDIRRNRFSPHSSVTGLLTRLAGNIAPGQRQTGANPVENQRIQQKIRSIFREHSLEEFVPESYQKKLDRIINRELDHRDDPAELPDLFETFDQHYIENQISDIIVRIMISDDDPEQISLLSRNLLDLFHYMLSTGDYEQLIHLISQCQSSELPQEIRDRLYADYTSHASLNEMLIGLTTWGKLKYDDITHLIETIGMPFIEVLLDRLATEEALSLRRFLMERIRTFGISAREAMLARLTDRRWYFLRNLIIMLRNLDDVSVVEYLRPLLQNTNLKVRQEAMRACLQFRDPVAERQLLYDMDSPDHELQLSAIVMAEKSRSADVFNKLVTIIGRSGFNVVECELKSAAATALAEMGRPEVLPELAKLLSARSLLNARPLAKLKIDIVRSMGHYPSAIARPVLTKIAEGNGDIARHAQAVLKTLVNSGS